MASPSSATPSGRFRAFLASDWDRWLRETPELATIVGCRDHDARWTDDSPEGIAQRTAHLEEAYREASGFVAAELDPKDRLDLELYTDLLAVARDGLRFGQDALPFRLGSPRNLRLPLSQIDGIHLNAPDLLMMQPRASVDDYRVVLRRLAALPAAVDQQRRLLEEGRRAGWLPCKVPLRSVPEQLAAVAAPAEGNPILQPFLEWPTTVPTEARRGLAEEARHRLETEVAPAFERLRRYVTETYLPAARDDAGASGLPDGEAWYRYLVRWQTTTALTAREIHEIGLREVGRTVERIETVRVAAGYAGSTREFRSSLRTDPKFAPPSADEMLTAYRSLAKRIDPELGRLFGRLPRLPYGIEPVPEYRAAASPTAYYMSGASSTGRAGYFYVNTFELAARPTWERVALTLHEAVPGHHLQTALADEETDLPAFRRFTGYTPFVEGWGLYAESLGDDLELYADPYDRYGQLAMDAWRSARLVVDTGMHALGWSRQQAIDYLTEATGKSERDIVAEVDRYIVWPGQALAYKIGQLKLRELRTRAEKALGARFDLRAFHDFVLAGGGLPLDTLDRGVDRWIAERA